MTMNDNDEPLIGVGRDELVAWLSNNGYAEDLPGYGHVDCETLAEALLTTFGMRWYIKP